LLKTVLTPLQKNFTFDLQDWRFICYLNVDNPSRSASEDTLAWFENALEEARIEGKKIIVCTHCRIDEDHPGEFAFSNNSDEQRAKINTAVDAGAKVKYVFQAHHNVNAHTSLEGVDYYTFKDANDTGSCAVLEIKDDDSLIILGVKKQDSYGNIKDFYVDGINGDDANSGMLRYQAWKTLSHANDNIENGQTMTVLPHIYREDFRPDGGSADSSRKWTFEPGCKISGAEVFINWPETADANGWYTIENVVTEVKVLLEDGVRLNEGDHILPAEAGSWDWNGNILYYKPSSGKPRNHTVEGGQRDRGMGIYEATDLIIEGDGLTLYGCNKDGLYLFGADDSVQMTHFISRDNGRNGIWVSPSDSSPCNPSLSRFIVKFNGLSGVYMTDSSPELSYGVVSHNVKNGLSIQQVSDAKIYNVVSAYNNYGIKLENISGNVELRNIISSNNSTYNFYALGDGAKTISHSCVSPLPENVWGNTDKENVYSEEPLFVAPSSGDFRLQWNSPCIDAGVEVTGFYDQMDLAGNPVSSIPDIGAYEYVPNCIQELADVIIALQMISGVAVAHSICIDVNGDQKIGLEEVISILQELSGRR